MLTQLDIQDDVSIRRALILTLGEFSEQQLPPVGREQSTPRLLDLYANDPDPGIHGAAAWTLRQWGRQADLERIDREFATGSPVGHRRWFVNRQGRTLVIIPPPGEFVIGSPPNEVGREGGPEGGVEMQRHVRIDHAFAVMIHQVTVAEVPRVSQGFLLSQVLLARVRLSDQQYYLVRRGGLLQLVERAGGHPEGPMVLPAERPGRVRPGDEDRGGLSPPDRLPSADRGGMGVRLSRRLRSPVGTTARAWTWTITMPGPCRTPLGRRTALVGSFKPNDLGLFDMLGNTLDWCHNAFRDHSRAVEVKPGDGHAVPEIVSDRQWRALRSPTLAHCPETVRAAFFDAYAPNVQIYGVGLRVSRTYLPDEAPTEGREVTNAERLALRGSTPIEPSEGIRSSVRLRFSPNLGLFAFGFRPARTVE